MAKTNPWQDEYWLPALQLYLRKPVGVKPLYQRDAVQLCLELHVTPKTMHKRLEQIALLSTPRLERVWQTYSKDPDRLARAVRLWREMRGFGAAEEFYDGVELQETFEKDFRPLDEHEQLTPVALILVLDLYFRLVPQTMVAETPEVRKLAKLVGVSASQIEELLHLYQLCDPYLNRNEVTFSNLLLPCQQVWQRFENTDPNALSAFAEELKVYFR